MWGTTPEKNARSGLFQCGIELYLAHFGGFGHGLRVSFGHGLADTSPLVDPPRRRVESGILLRGLALSVWSSCFYFHFVRLIALREWGSHKSSDQLHEGNLAVVGRLR